VREVRKQDQLPQITDRIVLRRTGKEATKMIRWMRSGQVAHPKYPQAMQWAKEITEFVNKKYRIQTSVYFETFGKVGTIRWFTDHADFAAYEKVRNQYLADQEYWQIVNRSAELFIQGSFFDTVMQSI